MRGRRGRPPKTLDGSPAGGGGGPAGSLRYRASGVGRGRGLDRRLNHVEAGGRGSRTPRGGKAGSRGRAKASAQQQQQRQGGGRSRRLAVNKVIYDDHESEEDDESLVSEDDDEEDERENEEEDEQDSDYLQATEEEEEEEDDDGSYCTESSFRSHSTYSSTPGRRRQARVYRSRSPLFEETDVPLDIPKCSEDLLVPSEELLSIIAIYEVLNTFGAVLRLSPFRFEDFCASLVGQEQCTLIAEMHIALLKAILREEDSSNTTFGPADLKDSINSTLYLIDGMTWPELVRAYCESDREYHHVLPYQEKDEYPYGPIENKIKVLQFLVDQFLTTNIAREELMSEGVIQYDDHCRVCHKLGDLLCCETCSAVYHLECVKPPLEEVPEDEWQCEICVAHKVLGVCDCVPEIQKNKPYVRHEPIGYDRHRRKYWFLTRRIIIEEDKEDEKDKRVWYYSSKVQLAELIESLDKEYWEYDLCRILEEMRDEIHRHMDITEDLTNKVRGNNKSCLSAANGNGDSTEPGWGGLQVVGTLKQAPTQQGEEILEHQKAKQEAEMEEVKQKAAEQAEKAKRENEDIGQMEIEKNNEASEEQTEEKDKDSKETEENLQEKGTEDPTPSADNCSSENSETLKSDGNSQNASAEENKHCLSKDTGARELAHPEAEKLTEEKKLAVESVQLPLDRTEDTVQNSTDTTTAVKTVPSPLTVDDSTSNVDLSSETPTQDSSFKIAEDLENMEGFSQSSGNGQEDAEAEELGSDKTNGENGDCCGAGKGSSIPTRMVTRLRNPESKLSQLKSAQAAAAVHEANKSFKEGREVLVVNSQGEVSRLSTRKDLVMKGIVSNLFKLGQEGKYRVYQNQYSTSTLALNKHQHREDHDKRRHLSHKFCMTPAGEFKWNGAVHGSKVLTISTLRLTIIQLENNIPSSFLHPNWASHRSNWIKAVQMCSKPREFALALAILECAIKPVVMLPVWRDSLGHTRFYRLTSVEREEKEKIKKRERKLEEEEVMQQATWVKYTFPVKHQVWKQKGEEYRVTGYGGWMWISKTHVHRFVPRLPGNTNIHYRKELEGVLKDDSKLDKNECSSTIKREPETCKKHQPSHDSKDLPENDTVTDKSFEIKSEEEEKVEEKEEVMEIDTNPDSQQTEKKESNENIRTDGDKLIKEEPMNLDETKNESGSQEQEKFISTDLLNVSEAFQLRTWYKKRVKTSKLDGLLDRRVKQFTMEEKQRQEKLKQEALMKLPKNEQKSIAEPQKSDQAGNCLEKKPESVVQEKEHVGQISPKIAVDSGMASVQESTAEKKPGLTPEKDSVLAPLKDPGIDNVESNQKHTKETTENNIESMVAGDETKDLHLKSKENGAEGSALQSVVGKKSVNDGSDLKNKSICEPLATEGIHGNRNTNMGESVAEGGGDLMETDAKSEKNSSEIKANKDILGIIYPEKIDPQTNEAISVKCDGPMIVEENGIKEFPVHGESNSIENRCLVKMDTDGFMENKTSEMEAAEGKLEHQHPVDQVNGKDVLESKSAVAMKNYELVPSEASDAVAAVNNIELFKEKSSTKVNSESEIKSSAKDPLVKLVMNGDITMGDLQDKPIRTEGKMLTAVHDGVITDNDDTVPQLKAPRTDDAAPQAKAPKLDDPASRVKTHKLDHPVPQTKVPNLDDDVPQVKAPRLDDHVQQVKTHLFDDAAPQVKAPRLDDPVPQVKTSRLNDAVPQLKAPMLDNTFPHLKAPSLDDAVSQVKAPRLDDTVPQLKAPSLDDAVSQVKAPRLDDTVPQLKAPSLDDAASQVKAPRLDKASTEANASRLEHEQLPVNESKLVNISEVINSSKGSDLLNVTLDKSTETENIVKPLEIDGQLHKKATSPPLISVADSTLSKSFSEQNGIQSESEVGDINGDHEVKTVTKMTTTTTTISTESKTVVSVTEASSLQSNTPSVVSCIKNCAVSSTTTTTTTFTKVTSPKLDSTVDAMTVTEKTVVTTTVTDCVATPGGMSTTTMTVSKEYSTKDKVKLMRFCRPKKTRSGTALPSYRKFITKSSKKSIFVLPNDDLRKLARRSGIREVPGFNYNAKPALDIWPYPSPRPTFGIAWRYRLQTVKSLAGVSLMLRLLWACLRWDDMAVKPPSGVTSARTETTETDITTTEIIKRRDVGPYGIRSEYCIRKIICPIGVPETPKETPTPQRKGLRSSALRPKKIEAPKQTGPVIIETWVPEEELDLWEIRNFAERVEKEKAQAAEQQAKKRLEQQKLSATPNSSSTASTTNSTATTIATPQKIMVGSLTGQVSPGTKVVFTTTKVGSPTTVTFQPNKNFQQSFATWIKQGQSGSVTSTVATTGTTIATTGQTFQITGSPVTMTGKVITAKLPLTANSKILTVNVPTTQGGVVQVQQKVLGIIPSGTTSSQQTFTSFQPRATTVTLRQNAPGTTTTTQQVQVLTTGGATQIRPGVTVIRAPFQQAAGIGKAIIRTPLMVQQGILPATQNQQVVTQIIRGQPVTTVSGTGNLVQTSTQKMVTAPSTSMQPIQSRPATPQGQQPAQRPQQGQVRLTMAQLTQLTQGQSGGQGLTVVIQGQGQTTGQLQLIPQGVSVIPGPGQQLMQAAMPSGTIQRFLFTPLPTVTASAAATTVVSASTATAATEQKQVQTHVQQMQAPIQPSPQPSPPSVQTSVASQPLSSMQPAQTQIAQAQPVVQVQAPPQTQPVVQTQAPLQVQVPQVQVANPLTIQSPPRPPLQPQQHQANIQTVAPQPQLQPRVPTPLAAETQALPQVPPSVVQHQIKLQVPVQIQQPGLTPAQQIQNVVSVQAASVQEQLQRIQQIREQQQHKKQLQIEAKREHMLQTANQNEIIQKQVVMKQNAVIEHLKAKSRMMSPAEREENQRMIVCNQVMKYILDKIDKEEKQAAKKRKRDENVEQKRSKQNATKLSALLFKHKEQLKAEILKKRALLDKELQIEVQEELKKDRNKLRKEKEKAQAAAIQTAAIAAAANAVQAAVTQKRKREEEKEPAKVKKKKMISTTSKESKKDTKLYCICKTPYDESKFYIGCDLCTNWYHGECVGITEKEAKKMDEYICNECKRAQEGSSEELYCICRTPYDESQFYIGCDRCQNWYHGRCVGILQSEADLIDEYVCPQCQSTEDAMTVLSPLSDKDYEGLRRVLRSLQAHKMAWPFLEPVDPNDAPDYYGIIKEPMDLATMEERIHHRFYKKLTDFVGDMTKIFDNCRYYNPSDSPFYQCAEILESFFVQKLKTFKANRSHS
ncbi:nucleosome-remodeling factor subunit BPTF isoform X6 [Scyliorhinus canicula]|uniref:nucleosome-remodeling factor subunit BPTF isoform X6 n=1 Tax=Scyliorhinus canicula TaxID=7830 RepID=UPI0018F478D4|nr:nucleosome-remodeling factor subunit BPTF isoform X6 [Scyliorhinus canicula]